MTLKQTFIQTCSDVVSTPSTQLLMEIEHLKENDVMKIHLSSELNKLQEENKMLRKKIKTMETSSVDTGVHLSDVRPANTAKTKIILKTKASQ